VRFCLPSAGSADWCFSQGRCRQFTVFRLFDEVSDKTINFLDQLLVFGSENWSGPVLRHMSDMIWFGLLVNVREFDQIEVLGLVIFYETEDVGKVRNNFWIIKNHLSFNGLLQVFGGEGNRK
jgi:hypothetical protein